MPDLNPVDEFDSLSGAPVPGIDDAAPADQRADGQADGDVARLKAELAAARADADEQRDRYLRSLADFENYKKRVDRTTADRSAEGRRDLLKRVLGVLDNLYRAAAYREQGAAAEQLVDGLLATVKQFTTLLENEGVRPIEVVGRPFDPAVAEAVATRPNADVAEHTVLDEARKGYRIGDEVLRPAQVIVSTAD
ncbi:MAG TPA: nucleotide exchange factor GrpE [Candidatus Eremiobacteraceae bacterium]|nr:nucleotide exchange factor GrpE [Candidatus Eremiobacteraceae bacterium]